MSGNFKFLSDMLTMCGMTFISSPLSLMLNLSRLLKLGILDGISLNNLEESKLHICLLYKS